MRRAILAVGLSLWAGAAAAQSGDRQIVDVSAGFGISRNTDVNLKLGHWAPVVVTVETSGVAEFRGKLVLSTADFDDSENTVVVPSVVVPKSASNGKTSQRFVAIMKFCKDRLPVDARLVQVEEDGSEREVHRYAKDLQESNLKANIVLPRSQLICYYGASGALVEIKEKAEQRWGDTAPTLARFSSEKVFPAQWMGYGGVDAFVLMTGDEKLFDRLPPDRQSALRTWVRQGGHLVVCCAKNWQIVRDSFLGPMLPAQLDGVLEMPLGKSGLHTTLTSYALPGGSNKVEPSLDPAVVKSLPMLKMSAPRGPVQKTQDDLPWLADGAYGLGRVTLVGFDFEDQPLSQWAKAPEFWTKLLKLHLPKENEPQGFARNAYGESAGLADGLAQALESFPDVKVVPFHWVALLIFLYILLIGPVDYFLLKKVFKRLELTWITFPLWVVAISAAAYWSAYLLKGNDLLINRLEIVDVDQASGTLRGSAFVGLFSPRIAKYDVAYTPDLAAGGKWGDLAAGPGSKTRMGEDQLTGVTSAFGVPSATMRGPDSGGSLLSRPRYATEPMDRATLLGIRGAQVQVWSVKSFASQWLGAGKPPLEAKLRISAASFGGTLTNLLDVPLEDVVVACQQFEVKVRVLPPKTPVDFNAVGQGAALGQAASGNNGSVNRFDTGYLNGRVAEMTYRRLMSARAGGGDPGVQYLSGLDLSHQLELGRIVVVARAPNANGGSLWLDHEPAAGTAPPTPPGKTVTHAYLRVVLDPVKEQP